MDSPTRWLLIAVQFAFGVFPLLGKIALTEFEPRAVLVWRLLVGSSVILAVAAWRHGRAALPGPRDLVRLAGLSLLGVIINQYLFLEGLHRSTAVNAGLLMAVIPVGTCGLAVALGVERLTTRKRAGIALAVVGVVWLFAGRGASVGRDTLMGDLMLATNALSYSFFLVFAKPVLARLPNLVVVAWLFLFGAFSVPWLALDVAWVPAGAERVHWLALAGVLLFPTILAYIGNAIVLSRTHASTTAVFVMLQPFIAAGLGMLVLGERPDPAVWLTGALVLSGLWLVSTPGWGADRAW